MKCYVKLVGLIDKEGIMHYVEFFEGLNIITGKSSTGKSAVIEIFDYCFGSGDFTVPEGIITTRAEIYFSVLKFQSVAVVLARRGESDSCFIKEIADNVVIESLKSAGMSFFSKKYFMPLGDFKKELGRYFHVTLTDVDEDVMDRSYSGRKSSTPSIRSFASFMFQHQNLVANKHAIFFRFDEKAKREQAIDHFKIFLGLADQEYFVLSQMLNEKKRELKNIEISLPKKVEEKSKAKEQIIYALKEYSAISGSDLTDLPIEMMVANPQRALDVLGGVAVIVNPLSPEFERQRSSLEKSRSITLAKLRGLERRRAAARSSLDYASNFKEAASKIELPDLTEVGEPICPFCGSQAIHAVHEANKLTEAINWLNGELRLSPYMRESFSEDEKRTSSEIDVVRQELSVVQTLLDRLHEQTHDLEKKRSVSELAMRAKLRVEATLELLVARSGVDHQARKEQLDKEIRALSVQINKYNMASRLSETSQQIEFAMKEIGGGFEFEESYRPINLRFSLETFDLWHERLDGKKIFLRAMGSGANWLYCHLTLFMALHRVFSLNSNGGCKIPPILFLDQPTQVYFPNYKNDDSEEFDPEKLVLTATNKDEVDEDLRAVVNMYNKLVAFCDGNQLNGGLRPQVIVTDHADHLKLDGDAPFESYVRARWRTRGFIA